jgi:hypothetical protein
MPLRINPGDRVRYIKPSMASLHGIGKVLHVFPKGKVALQWESGITQIPPVIDGKLLEVVK